jgi:hypothetical protein
MQGKRPTHKDKFLVGKVVDSIDFHTKKFNKFTEEAVAMQKHAWPRSYVVFVVFKDVSTYNFSYSFSFHFIFIYCVLFTNYSLIYLSEPPLHSVPKFFLTGKMYLIQKKPPLSFL